MVHDIGSPHRSTKSASDAGGGHSLYARFMRHPATAWGVLAWSLLLTALVWYGTDQFVSRRAQDHFQFQTEEVRGALLERMRDYDLALRGAVGLFRASKLVERDEWRHYVASLDIQHTYPGIQGLGFSQVIPAAELASHEATIRAEGFPDYRVRPAGIRPIHTSIIYLEPFDWRNQRAFGYDMFSEPVRREAMERARDSGMAAVSGLLRLVQETDRDVQNGFLMYWPVYRNGSPTATVDERRAALAGYVFSPFRVNDLMQGILPRHLAGINLQIFDGDQPRVDRLLYLSQPETAGTRRSTGYTFEHTLHLNVGDRTWTLHLHALPGYVPPVEANLPPIFALGGLIASLLLFLYIRALASQQRQALALAKAMTTELRDSEENYRTLVEFAPDPIIVMDEKGMIQDCNPVAEQFFGYRMEELVGQSINVLMPSPHREAHDVYIARYLAGGTAKVIDTGHDVTCLRKDASQVTVHLRVGEHLCEDGSRRFIGFVRDLSDRMRVERELEGYRRHLEDLVAARTAELQEAESRIRLILESSADGLFGFDNEGRFSFVNPAACRMLGYAPGELDGRPVHASIHSRYPDGRPFPAEECQTHARLRKGEAVRVEHDTYWRADGQPLPVSVASQPMWRYGEVIGAVVSFTDISQRLASEATLRRQAEELRTQFEALGKFNQIMVGREMDMIHLKQRVNELCGQLGQAPPYDLSFLDTPGQGKAA
jgi:PAS domain S-box-containing protein